MANKKSFQIRYAGSIAWLIFWAIIFFPVALVLLLTGGEVDIEGKKSYIEYNGSRGWLCFWIILFFPVGILLIVLNGISLVQDELPRPALDY